MYIMCVVLCLFSALSRRVGALQIVVVVVVVVVVVAVAAAAAASAAAAVAAAAVRRCSYFHAEAAFPN